IAAPDDDLSFLDRVQKEGEDYGYADFVSSVDTVILGRKTYDWVMDRVDEFPHADKKTYVVTRSEKPPEGNIIFYTGDLKELITGLKKKPGKNIFCDGGAQVVNEILREKLFDEMIISVIPVLLGNGIRLFQDNRPEQGVELLSARQYETGLVQLHYRMTDN
ncbi:MAG: dihydrofolate reductase, partial [Candidatus Marinimicrobia bacterium]|nr:dihydrofolate reductase [Candidatus Neomarinimicrobiota bacterium]